MEEPLREGQMEGLVSIAILVIGLWLSESSP